MQIIHARLALTEHRNVYYIHQIYPQSLLKKCRQINVEFSPPVAVKNGTTWLCLLSARHCKNFLKSAMLLRKSIEISNSFLLVVFPSSDSTHLCRAVIQLHEFSAFINMVSDESRTEAQTEKFWRKNSHRSSSSGYSSAISVINITITCKIHV